jgi:hypothetical protein
MAKATVTELRESIVEAVSLLDESDGSRTGMTQAIDDARSVLQTVYGDSLDEDVREFLGVGNDLSEDEDFDEE